MANPFYSPGGQHAEKVSDLFAAVARRYDLVNDLQSFGLHRLWKRRLVRLASIHPGERALDVCCGTGDIAFALARRGATVVGLDFSQSMLAVAEGRRLAPSRRSGAVAHREGGTVEGGNRKRAAGGLCADQAVNPQFQQGDAQAIPFEDNTFEVVTVGYGLRNLTSWEAGLSEMRRVAKPGGRLLVLDFGKPDNAFWRVAYFGYLKFCVPLLGRIFCGNASAYAYILESLKLYPAQRGVADRMRSLGLIQVRVVNLLGGIMSIHYAEKPKSDDGADGI